MKRLLQLLGGGFLVVNALNALGPGNGDTACEIVGPHIPKPIAAAGLTWFYFHLTKPRPWLDT